MSKTREATILDMARADGVTNPKKLQMIMDREQASQEDLAHILNHDRSLLKSDVSFGHNDEFNVEFYLAFTEGLGWADYRR